MIELIKTLGSFVGLLTGAVFFYDRLAKGRPIAYFFFKEDENRSAFIRIENLGSFSVAILDVTCKPDVFGFSDNLERRFVVRSVSGETPSFMLAPTGVADLFLISKFDGGLPLELKAQSLRFRITWRRGNATWLPQFPVYVRTSMETIRTFSINKRR